MTEIILIRHGQATLGGPCYDQLSELGQQQAQWLAEHLSERGYPQGNVAQLLTGCMDRQRQTAAALAELVPTLPRSEHAGFNEFDFEQVVMAYLVAHPDYLLSAKPTANELAALLRLSMLAWSAGTLVLPDDQETWLGFHGRVADAWQAIEVGKHPTIFLVTSAGVIASIVRYLLRLDDAATIRLNLQIRNASMTRIVHDGSEFSLNGFNLLPHLERADRQHALTFA